MIVACHWINLGLYVETVRALRVGGLA